MKKLIYSLIALAGLFTLASCQPDKLLGGKDVADGVVDATFSVTLSPGTKAIADGTTVDKLYAGIYEMGSNDTYTWVADNADAPVAISAGGASVTFNGKIALGKSYKVVFWAQKEGAPYAIDWAKAPATTGPTVTATATGAANAESRDAFFGTYETGAVTGSIDLTGSPVTLKRPFSQVNVLVPTANFADATAAVTSSMTVKQAPTVLNLASKATSDPANWTFSTASINEAAFGTYANSHRYVAMNYVLVDQATAGAQYDVTFSVTAGSQVAADKQVKNVPLKVNGRTNIVGNVFAEDFDITVPIIIDPGVGSEQELTTVTVTVGQTAAEAVELTFDQTNPTTTSIPVAVSHPVQVEADKPQITVEPANVATAEWNLTTGKLDVTPLVANGNALITLVFPAVTKTAYSAATVKIYIKVGNGKQEQTLSFANANEAATMGTTYTLQAVTGAQTSVSYSSSNAAVATIEGTTVTLVGAGETTITATAAGNDDYNEGSATYTLTVSAAPVQKQDQTLSFANANEAATIGTPYTLQTVTGAQTAVTYTSSNTAVATIEGTTVTLVAAGETTITATAAGNDDYNEGSATYTLTVSAAATPDFTTVAELKAKLGTESATLTGTLTDAVVSFVAGTKDAVIKDATGSILYHKEAGHELLQGQTISGDVIVDAVLYNGINQITDLAATVEGTGSAVEPQVVTLAQLVANYATYESAYVKVVGVTSKTTTTAKGSISVTQDATDYIVYTNVAIPVNTGDIFTAEGTVTKYNTTEEVKVWKSADLTVTTAAPVLSATPATKTVNADVTSVTWNITSNTDWTITPGTGVTPSATAGNGNAEITLSFAANTGSEAATYTATASATGCDDVTITITQNGAGEVTPISITASAASICSASGYAAYSNDDWIITCGSNNGTLGSNSNNADGKMKLGSNYIVATALDNSINADSTHYAALISKNKLDAGITTITLGGSIGSNMTVGVTVSTNGTTWTKLADFGTDTEFSFTAQQSVYYAIVIKAANKSNARYTDFTATFSN